MLSCRQINSITAICFEKIYSRKAIYIFSRILVFILTPSLSIFVKDKKNYDNEILSNKFLNKFRM